MSVYLDASVLVALFTIDANSRAVDEILKGPDTFVLSDFASAEFASAVSRKVRTGELTRADARAAFANFDLWREHWQRIETEPSDIVRAQGYLRRLDNSLRTPDALNVAIADRVGCRLSTFDRRMADDARKVGVTT